MWKKFLAVMAITGLLSAQSAFAADPVPGDGPSPYTPLISSATVTPSTFNPSVGETTTLKVTVSQSAYIGVKVYNSASRTLVSTVVPSVLVQANTEKAISYNGKTGNQALTDGQYYFQVAATNVAGTTTEYNTKNFVIVSTPQGTTLAFTAPFALSTTSFNPTAGASLKFNYFLSKTPSEVSIVIDTIAGVNVLTISDAAPTSKDGSLSWDGTINHGATTVPAGNYKATFSAKSGAEEIHSQPVNFSVVYSTPSVGVPEIKDLKVDPISFKPTTQTTAISFTLVNDATVTLEIKSGTTVVSTFSAWATAGAKLAYWDGKDDTGKYLDNGTYTVVVTAVNTSGTDTESTTVKIDYSDQIINSTILKNVHASPNPWDPSDDELSIEWEFAKDVNDFSLVAKEVGGNDEVELWDDEDMDKDDYELDWNGLDEDDEMIEEGSWELVFKADNDTVSYFVTVQYSQVAINSDLFVTKTPFDNSIGEFTYVVFRVDQTSKVTVEVTESGKTKDIVTLMDEEEISKNKWTTVKWDGEDEDGDEVDEGNYKFKITAANPSNEDVKTFAYADVTVEEDEISSKTNATNDFITPVVVDKNASADDTNAVVEYTIDDDAEVTVEIFKGSKSSNPEIVLEKNVSKSEGTYVLYWNGRDEDGKKLDKNEKYSYRVTAKTEGSTNKTDKERGFFVVSTEGTKTPVTPVTPPPVVVPPVVEPVDCGFWDVDTSSEYCEAINWVKDAGIFEGNPNGAFKPYNFINRAEALKVTLKAFSVSVLPDDYTNLGFSDVTVGAWYMKYIRTGKFYGMVNGYGGTTLVKPGEQINRVELLKYVMEASETVGGYDVPVCTAQYYSDTQAGSWYSDYICLAHDYNLYNTYAGYFYPGSQVMRGEVALLLYRLAQAGLLQ